MKRKCLTIGGIGLATILMIAFLLFTGNDNGDGKNVLNTIKPANSQKAEINTKKPEEVDYSKSGNSQGNLENGGLQVFGGRDQVLLNLTMDNEDGRRMLYFDTKDAILQLACDKKNCLHNDNTCLYNNSLMYLQGYASVYFGVPLNFRNEIWKYEDDTLSSFYRSQNDIVGLWGYGGYLYFMTDFGVFRVDINNPEKSEQVLDRPVAYEDLTFDGEKMYYCEEDALLYSANLDGSGKVRISDEKIYFPQVFNNRIYYRSAEYDKNGTYEKKNALCSITLEGKDKKTILNQVFQINIQPDGIYYITLPNNQESMLCYIGFDGKNQKKLTNCSSNDWGVFAETDWILFNKPEGELPPGEEGGRPSHLYCIKKDGSQEKRLDYPQTIEE